jgi:hypothetical protein
MERRLYGDLDDAQWIATDRYLIGWAALFWALGTGTGYLAAML